MDNCAGAESMAAVCRGLKSPVFLASGVRVSFGAQTWQWTIPPFEDGFPVENLSL
jgi:hypothetical protein